MANLRGGPLELGVGRNAYGGLQYIGRDMIPAAKMGENAGGHNYTAWTLSKRELEKSKLGGHFRCIVEARKLE